MLAHPIWADLAIFLFLLLVVHLLIGHFEDYKPKWRRVGKVILGVAIFTGLYLWSGRVWAWGYFIAVTVILGAVVHGWWLPKHGINGWTGEPRDKYLELVGARPRLHSKDKGRSP
jgi:hypothetical protein